MIFFKYPSFAISIFLSLNLAIQVRAQVGLEGFASGRYEVRRGGSRSPASEVENHKIKEEMLKSSRIEGQESQGNSDVAIKNKNSQPNPSTQKNKINDSSTFQADYSKKPTELKETELQKNEAIAENQKVSVEPPIKVQAEDLFSGKANKIYSFYNGEVSQEDTRLNRTELDVSPAVVYQDAHANYSFRDYQSFYNALKIRSNLWFTPRIGLSAQVMLSIGADVDTGNADRSRMASRYEFFDFGLNFRTFFDLSPKSNSAEISVLYSDNKMTVPNSNTTRAKLSSQGLGLGLKVRIPQSSQYSWVGGGNFYPMLQHSEGKVGANIASGSSGENVRFGFVLGGEWKLSRGNQILWNLETNVERNLFEGTAQSLDPKTGQAPMNVSVTNAFYVFSLGYRWGN